MIKVFVTYSWDNEDHNSMVKEFTNNLRENGYHAEMDVMKAQEQTAINFTKMMHQAMTDYEKVIIVLSKGYKEKGDAFKNGVGTEYEMILNQINEHPNKFILVSFDGISNEIVPAGLKGRDIVSLNKGENEFIKLNAKLQDVILEKFSDVSTELVKVESREIGVREIEKKNIEFQKVNESFEGDSRLGGKIQYIQSQVCFSLINNSGKTVEGCNVSIEVDSRLLAHDPDKPPVLDTQYNDKFFTGQKLVTNSFSLKITPQNFKIASESKIIINIFSDLGKNEIFIDVLDCIHTSKYGQKVKLEEDDFYKQY